MTGQRRAEDRAFFRERYARERRDASRAVERDVLGDDVGLNGYTTIEQARALAQALGIGPGYRLLELGAGRGWPGTLVTEATGCRTVLSDVPIEALRDAREYADRWKVGRRTSVVAAAGHALPFPSGAFDAVSHADVFC